MGHVFETESYHWRRAFHVARHHFVGVRSRNVRRGGSAVAHMGRGKKGIVKWEGYEINNITSITWRDKMVAVPLF